jgi:hypothetical protein
MLTHEPSSHTCPIEHAEHISPPKPQMSDAVPASHWPSDVQHPMHEPAPHAAAALPQLTEESSAIPNTAAIKARRVRMPRAYHFPRQSLLNEGNAVASE